MAHACASAIVVVTGKAPHLALCLESLAGQSAENMQVFVHVSRVCKDECEIAKLAAQKAGMHVIEDPDSNPWPAALDCTADDYIVLLDPEEFLALDCMQQLFVHTQDDRADIIEGRLAAMGADAPDPSASPQFVPLLFKRQLLTRASFAGATDAANIRAIAARIQNANIARADAAFCYRLPRA